MAGVRGRSELRGPTELPPWPRTLFQRLQRPFQFKFQPAALYELRRHKLLPTLLPKSTIDFTSQLLHPPAAAAAHSYLTMATGVDAKLLKSTKFPPEFSQKVDMTKVNLQVMKK